MDFKNQARWYRTENVFIPWRNKRNCVECKRVHFRPDLHCFSSQLCSSGLEYSADCRSAFSREQQPGKDVPVKQMFHLGQVATRRRVEIRISTRPRPEWK